MLLWKQLNRPDEVGSGPLITRIETIAIRVPLDRVFRGSHYQMTNRSTIIVRVHTTEGIVGEAYVGDEDTSLLEIEGIIQSEISPGLLGLDIFATERCWEAALPATFDILRDRRLGLVADGGDRCRNLGRCRQSPGPATLALVGRVPQSAAADRDRRLLLRAARRDR